MILIFFPTGRKVSVCEPYSKQINLISTELNCPINISHVCVCNLIGYY